MSDKQEVTDFYTILEVAKNATQDEIRESYKKLVVKHHPDKAPTEIERYEYNERFKEISRAYTVLSDESKRSRYDQFGPEAAEEETLQEQLAKQYKEQRKVASIKVELNITLNELYTGTTKTIEFKRKGDCEKCEGSGDVSKNNQDCKECHGAGKVVKNILNNPTAEECPRCHGSRKETPNPCAACEGSGITDVNVTTTVDIPAGYDSSKIKLTGLGHNITDLQAGDVHVYLLVSKHETFTLQGNNLRIKKEITLKESICGFDFEIKTLDNRDLVIVMNEITGNCTKVIKGEGMLTPESDKKGDLLIEYSVMFPKKCPILTEKNLINDLPGTLGLPLLTNADHPAVVPEDYESETEEEDHDQNPLQSCMTQ